MIGTGLFLLPFTPVRAQQPVELVILIDLSQSVGARAPDGRSEFQQNVVAISRVLRQVPTGAHVTIIGLTDDSFSEPYRPLSATVAAEPGYFGEKLSAARQRLDGTWRARPAKQLSESGLFDGQGVTKLAKPRPEILYYDPRSHGIDQEDPSTTVGYNGHVELWFSGHTLAIEYRDIVNNNVLLTETFTPNPATGLQHSHTKPGNSPLRH